jgi:hypothetical protein
LAFLETIFPTEESCPDYICIDKACAVLHTAIANRSWATTWASTIHFIVDSYHYINHQVLDYLCRKWCNPAPLDGSAPNLVVVKIDEEEKSYYKQAFNTQACENVLKRMTQGNFNWFLHAMLFYHTWERGPILAVTSP